MKKRILYTAGVILLTICVALVVVQGSFSMGFLGTPTADQTYLLWSVSILLFVLTVTLGFMLVRNGVKLYLDRRAGREGSRLRTKLVVGALALTSLPVFFLVLFSVEVLSLNINRWFSLPTENTLASLTEVSDTFDAEIHRRAAAEARALALDPGVREYVASGGQSTPAVRDWCRSHALLEAAVMLEDGTRLPLCGGGSANTGRTMEARHSTLGGSVLVRVAVPLDLAARQREVAERVREYARLSAFRKELRAHYLLLMSVITLFILFVATWSALYFSKRLSEPIAALLGAAGHWTRGNLDHRIESPAIDELATLVKAFNGMAGEIQSNERELERRRNFTEAILESIPTGVISLSAERRIQRVNPALVQMFGAERVARAQRVEDLLPVEEAKEIHYLLNRAKRTGVSSSQVEIRDAGRAPLHLAVTVSALVGRHTAGWVVLLEDTSELLRAEKAAAWQEVARRIAHELKNPLTPIRLSAERIVRQLDRHVPARADGGVTEIPADVARILRECAATIASEVESVKLLTDEFSQYARFPAAQPVPSELNDVVASALAVFQGRLDGVLVDRDLAANLPPVAIDREQFKRAIVNLVDNAAEAMTGSEVKVLRVATQAAGSDTVELTIADTGHGIAADDREKLFLPYFSTKARGTGLGLAIVQHILADHGARVRVEDNEPGARFVIEIPAMAPVPAAPVGDPVSA